MLFSRDGRRLSWWIVAVLGECMHMACGNAEGQAKIMTCFLRIEATKVCPRLRTQGKKVGHGMARVLPGGSLLVVSLEKKVRLVTPVTTTRKENSYFFCFTLYRRRML